jgi:small multidrug resistance pump
MAMSLYIILFFAIAFEVFGTMLLPASQNFSKLVPSTILLISYSISLYLMSFLAQKLSLAIIYATWAGMGVLSVALLSYFFYKQTLNWQSIIGLFLIIIGVTIVNMHKGHSL